MKIQDIVEAAFEQDFTKETPREKIQHLLDRLHALLQRFAQKTQNLPVNHNYLALDIIHLEKVKSLPPLGIGHGIKDFDKQIRATLNMYTDLPAIRSPANRDEYKQKEEILLCQKRIFLTLLELQKQIKIY